MGLPRDLIAGEYGLFTMGLSYGLAIVLPIIVTFFTAFALLEDSGYLPRLAVMSDRVFRLMGLNGKAVLPMVLGLGCDTMATLTTRILPTSKERLLATLLLALGVPCSAQLGVILAMLAVVPFAAGMVWFTALAAVMIAVGWLAARVLPGERGAFVVELPPMRLPALVNVLSKTAARVEWYLKEALPLFLVGTFVLFLLDRLRLLGAIIRAGEPLVTGFLGLPKEASAAFLIGFLRRDFAATRPLRHVAQRGARHRAAGRLDGDDHALHPLHRERVHDRARSAAGRPPARWRPSSSRSPSRRAAWCASSCRRPASGWGRDDPAARSAAAAGRRRLHLPDVRAPVPAGRLDLQGARLPDRDRRLRHAALPALRLHDAGRVEEPGRELVRTLFRRARAKPVVAGRLAELAGGATVVVERLDGEPELLARLTAQGIAPGRARPRAAAAAHVRDRGRRDHDRARARGGRRDRGPPPSR